MTPSKTTTAKKQTTTVTKRKAAQPEKVTKTAKHTKAAMPTAKDTTIAEPATTPVAAPESPRAPNMTESLAPAVHQPAGTTTAARQRDHRLPAPGTVIAKRDRHGSIRCTCTVQDNEILYNGKTYPSVSAAALAAAKDLGLKNTTQNGFTFWGLSKPQRRPTDTLTKLAKAWVRYHTIAATASMPEARDLITKHALQLESFRTH